MINLPYAFAMLFILVCVFLLAYSTREKKHRVGIKPAGALLLGMILFYMQGASILLLIPGIILFYFLGDFYGTRIGMYVSVVCIAFLLIASNYSPAWFVAQAAALGLLAGTGFRHTHKHRNDVKRETNRDLLQIFFGILLIALFFSQKLQLAETVALVFTVLGYLVANYVILSGNDALSNILKGLERNHTALGEGAQMLAIGTLVVIATLHAAVYIILVFIALYIGDSIATIVGINLNGTKLSYNKNKSVLGTFAYFGSVALISYPLIGWLGLLVGFVAAAAESISTPVDDNLFVAMILVFLMLL